MFQRKVSRKMNLAHLLPDTAWHTFSSKDTKAFILVLVKVHLSPTSNSEQTLGFACLQLLGKNGAYVIYERSLIRPPMLMLIGCFFQDIFSVLFLSACLT